MVVLVKTIGGQIALLTACMDAALHGLLGEDAGRGFVGCGAHNL